MNGKRMFALLLAGCLLAGMLWDPASASVRSQAIQDAGPELVDAFYGSGVTMDPALDYETAGGHFLAQVYDTLVLPPRYAEATDYIPNLAAGWDISTDGLTYTFYIRTGVHFADGAVLTPEDVAYTFRRGLLIGGAGTPQWLMFEPLLGTTMNNDISDLVDSSGNLFNNRAALQNANPAKLVSACNKVFQAVAYDNSTGTVTFHLAQKWNPFLETLTGSWGSILNKAWVVGLGGWDGACSTWQDDYATSGDESPINAVVNGTGPYVLAEVDSQSNIRLVSKPDYWRTEPMWPGGPTGEAYFKTVWIRNVSDSNIRRDMLLNGTAQLAHIITGDYDTMNAQVMLAYPLGSKDGKLLNPAGILKRYDSLGISANDGFFNYDVRTGGPRNYTGSGHLGDGIPADFFTDIHVRKAFSYAFDWETWIGDTMQGYAVQRRGVIPQGFVGYSDSQPVYSLDLDKAAQEFELAWNGAVANQGFTLTISYNTGNITRQRACEILKDNIESIDPDKYHVNILGLDWNTYLSDYSSRYIPFYITGWMADIHHPHNFAAAYLSTGGPYSWMQSLPQSMRSIFDPKVHECVTTGLDTMQACYEELQNMSYEYVVDLWGLQAYSLVYTRAEIQGYYRTGTGAVLYYTLSDAPLPVVSPVSEGYPFSSSFTEPHGGSGTVSAPVWPLAGDAHLVITPGKVVGDMTSGFRFGDLSFDITAYGPDGAKLDPDFAPGNPVQIVIHYDEGNLGGINESTLKLLYWDGESWEDAGCGPQVVDTDANTLTVPLCHFSDYAMAGYPLRYLPLLLGEGGLIE